MIDTGERRHGQYIVNYLLNNGIHQIDYLIITHFDSDHVGGAYIIINSMDVKNVIVPNYSRESNHVIRFETAMRINGIEAFVLTDTLKLTLDSIEFMINPARLEGVINPTGDDLSIIVSITHGENNFLFAGDAWNFRLRELLESEKILNTEYDFLKMPRHGRYSRHILEFIQAINPRYAVITGFHPDDLVYYYPERPADARVIAALENVGAEIYFAMSTGVRIVSDGKTLTVEYKSLRKKTSLSGSFCLSCLFYLRLPSLIFSILKTLILTGSKEGRTR